MLNGVKQLLGLYVYRKLRQPQGDRVSKGGQDAARAGAVKGIQRPDVHGIRLEGCDVQRGIPHLFPGS